MARRPHADLIEQWLADDSIVIESRMISGKGLWDIDYAPSWWINYEYRIKPARVYPVTSMTRDELVYAYQNVGDRTRTGFELIANAAIKRYIDDQESKK